MKRILALLIVLLLMATGMPSLAEDIGSTEPFVVGSPSALSGAFFTGMWGNDTSDIDVRALLHAYSPVVWSMQSLFEINPTVVQEVVVGVLDNGNKMYTINLYEDLKYNDGTPITARDYVFSLLLHGSPIVEQIGGNITSVVHIAGYEEYATGQSDIFAGVALISEYSFGIEINQDFLPFFYELGMLECYPYPISVIAPGCEVADDGAGAYIRNIPAAAAEDGTAQVTAPLFTAELLAETILNSQTGYLSNPKVTSGPYQLDNFDADNHIADFSINTNFKGDHTGQKPTIAKLQYVNITPETMLDDLRNRDVHLLNKVVSGENIDGGLAMQGEGLAGQATYPRTGFSYISFACEEGPTQFEAVRKAVAYSLDKEEFCRRYTTLNYGLPIYGYFGIGQWMVQMLLSPGTRPDTEDDAQTAAWDAMDLGVLETYAPDTDAARQVLIADGWTLNENGEEFVEGDGAVRYKEVNGELMPLILRFAKSEGSISGDILEEMLTDPLAQIGAKLETEAIPFTRMLAQYYRQEEREFEMMHLASNFTSIFDPYFTYNTDDEFAGEQNTTGYKDEELEKLALDMRETEPGDLLGYVQKWYAFQQYWNEKLPMLPLYSNVYFDFFIPELQGYLPSSQMSWATAILYAYIGDAADVPVGEAGVGGASSSIEGVSSDEITTIDD